MIVKLKNFMKKSKESLKKSNKEKIKRPSWDEYFIEIMHIASKRATCDRGRSACFFVKDKQVLCWLTFRFPHCDEVGHQIKKLIHGDGKITEHCMRTVHTE